MAFLTQKLSFMRTFMLCRQFHGVSRVYAESDSIKLIKELRALTSAPIFECKKALHAANNDVKKAQELLQASGLAVATKKSSRKAEEGLSGLIVSPDKTFACLMRLNCETDFVARNEEFQSLATRLTQGLYSVAPHVVTKVASNGLVQGSSTFGSFGTIFELSTEELLKTKVEDGSNDVHSAIASSILKLGENIQLRRAVVISQKDVKSTLSGYVHYRASPMIGNSALVLSLESDTAFPESSQDALQSIGKKLAIQIVGTGARYVTRSQVPTSEAEDLRQQGMSDEAVYGQLVLENQDMFAEEESTTVSNFLSTQSRQLKQTLRLSTFVLV